MPAITPAAVLFDLDGTLIDTEALAIAAQREVIEAAGHVVEPGFLEGCVGRDHASTLAAIEARYPGLGSPEADQRMAAASLRMMERGLPLKPGAEALLAALTLPVALVTSSHRGSAHNKLARTGLDTRFDQVITRDDVTQPKPAPEPYLLAASRLGVDPAACVVFEDSEIGSEAAFRAGCIVVQVPDIVPSARTWAHHVARDLTEGARMAGLALG